MRRCAFLRPVPARLLMQMEDYDAAEADAKRVVQLCRGAEKVKLGVPADAVAVAKHHHDKHHKQHSAEEDGAEAGSGAGDSQEATSGLEANTDAIDDAAPKKPKGKKRKKKPRKASSDGDDAKPSYKDARRSIGQVARGLLGEVRTARREAQARARAERQQGSR